MLKDFKEFAMKGNVVDLAVGIIIGSAFGTIVKSLVDDIIMPPIGYVLGNVDFTNLFVVLKDGSSQAGPYASLAEATKAGAVMIKYGVFANTIVSFVIVSFSVFLLIKQLNRFKKEEISTQVAAGPTPEVQVLTEIRDLLKK
ncbi:MAG: large conductance mechanosensitive channel protein MscL [Bacteriovorax sp.]|nr:large conductance mechanosensitive channel protein MscL [Bacteriovorax sp.]